MTEMEFTPYRIEIKRGEQIRFVIRNAGTEDHEFLLASTAENLKHAEAMKKNPKEQTRLFSIVRPVMEKVGSIINRHIEGQKVDKLYLVGGTCAYPGMDVVIQEYTGIETVLPGNPLFVTPLGIAMNN